MRIASDDMSASMTSLIVIISPVSGVKLTLRIRVCGITDDTLALITIDIIYLAPCIFFTLLINGSVDVFTNRMEGSVSRSSSALFSVLYPAIGLGLCYHLVDFHTLLLPILAILIWITDTFAYLIGMLWGRHRGFFQCSPKKSIEGFLGGFIFAFLGSFIVYMRYPDDYSLKIVMFLTISAGIIGQLGDLYESVLKRDFGVKDSSNTIPGHGGVLDRFDSLLIAGPTLYILVTFL
jgi:phosphatidate cytidylyltransferase